MVDGKTVKQDIAEEKERLSKMTYKQKKEHIWTYYKIPIIATILIVAGIIGTILMIKANDYENVFYVAIVDGKLTKDANGNDPLSLGFQEYLGIDGKEQRLQFDNNYTLTYTTALDQDPYLSAQKLQARMAAGNTDGFLADYSIINGFSTGADSSLMDLQELLSPEEFEKVKDRIIYFTMDDGTRIPNAIDMKDSKLTNELGLRMEHPCFGIVVSSSYSDNGAKFIRYIFDL